VIIIDLLELLVKFVFFLFLCFSYYSINFTFLFVLLLEIDYVFILLLGFGFSFAAEEFVDGLLSFQSLFCIALFNFMFCSEVVVISLLLLKVKQDLACLF
jgi:hypothetical protein